MAGDIHNGYTVLSALSVAGGTSTGTVALNAGLLSLGTHGLSITTASQMSLVADGCLGLTFHASGISLLYRSGSSIYIVGQSATSAARV